MMTLEEKNAKVAVLLKELEGRLSSLKIGKSLTANLKAAFDNLELVVNALGSAANNPKIDADLNAKLGEVKGGIAAIKKIVVDFEDHLVKAAKYYGLVTEQSSILSKLGSSGQGKLMDRLRKANLTIDFTDELAKEIDIEQRAKRALSSKIDELKSSLDALSTGELASARLKKHQWDEFYKAAAPLLVYIEKIVELLGITNADKGGVALLRAHLSELDPNKRPLV